MNGFVHRLERLSVELLESSGSLCTGVGVAGRLSKRWEFVGRGCHDRCHSELLSPAAGFRRRALSWKSMRASCPRSSKFLAANIAMSERLNERAQSTLW